MKKTIITAIAAIMMTSGAHAACSTKADVVAFNNVNTYNKSMLSDRDKCWHDVYTTENHGVDGNVFWLRVGGEYYSTQLINLATKAQREAWLGDIKIDISNSFQSISDTAEEIKTLTKTIEVIKLVVDESAIKLLQAQVDALQIELDAEIAKVAGLVIDNKALSDEIANLESQISDLDMEIADLKSQIAGHADALIAAENFGRTEVAKEYASLIVDINIDHAAEIQSLQNQINTLEQQQANMVKQNLSLQAIVNNMSDGSNAIEAAKAKSKLIGFYINGASNGKGYDNISGNTNGSAVAAFTGDSYEIELSTNIGTKVVGDSFYLGNMIDNAVLAEIANAVEDAYDHGYNDGYADGYADGFQDGVDSVK